MATPVGGSPNDQAYSNIKAGKAHATADANKDEKVDLQEAKTHRNSVFQQAESKGADLIQDAINSSSRLTSAAKSNPNAQSVVQKYLGGKSFTQMLSNWSGFQAINYQAKDLNDAEFENNVKVQIDAIVDPEIDTQVANLAAKVTIDFNNALAHAMEQAENELVGDADFDPTNVAPDGYSKLDDLKYKRTSDETGNAGDQNTNVATYTSAGKDATTQSVGYQTTCQYLEQNGAKAMTKLVNGTEQTVYKVKVGGETQYVTVDDAGQVHELSRDKGFLRASKFTTEDSIEDAKYQSRQDGSAGNDIPDDAKIQVRKVDGQLQSVATWKDENGQKHSRVIDHNEVTGLTTSADVEHVSAGGRAKYASHTSGLGAADSRSATDDIGFENGKFREGSWTDSEGNVHADYARTQRGRAKIDASNIDAAVTNISASVTAVGGNVTDNGDGTVKVEVNGHTYTIDKNNPQSADRIMRLIQGDVDATPAPPEPVEPGETTVDTTGVVEDTRKDTNHEANHTGERWRVGSGAVGNTGVDAPGTHQSSAGGRGKINSVRYGADLSRSQWGSEGWRNSAGRKRETEMLSLMDSSDIKGDGKSVRNLGTSQEFAERFVKAMKTNNPSLANNEYDTEKLGKAIAAANPSLFDADGNMYQNCDFSRLNIPKDLKNYIAHGKA